MQFLGFMLHQIAQKHYLGKVGKVIDFGQIAFSVTFLSKISKIRSCVLKI